MNDDQPFDAARAARVCELHAKGHSLHKICATEGMPSYGTLYRWMVENPSFAEVLERARRDQAMVLAQEIIEIADGASDKDETVVAKLRIDARRWMVETILLPPSRKKEGDAGASPIAVTISLDADGQAACERAPNV